MESRAQMGPRTGLARWSWRLGTIAGIEANVHASFLLILAWAGWNAWKVEASLVAVAVSITFLVLMFGCVLLHELGHALTARRFGIGTRSITLLPIGGVAQLEGMPKDGKQEFWVAIAGPAVNVAIAAVLFVMLMLTGSYAGTQIGSSTVATFAFMFAEGLMWANVALAVFNMLPAFPMDGGRVLRAALQIRKGRLKATEIAVTVGKVLAVLLGIWGLAFAGNPFLPFIAIFVWFTGQNELRAVRREEELKKMMDALHISERQLDEMREWISRGHGVIVQLPDGRRVQIS